MPSLYHRIFSTFKQTDKEFISKYKVKATAGCTAVALLTLGRLGVVCWVGDSRAVAGVQKAPMTDASDSPSGLAPEEGTRGLVAVRITEDHKPNRPDEKARIEKAGGHVVVVGGVARVAPSDYEVSAFPFLPRCCHSHKSHQALSRQKKRQPFSGCIYCR